MAIVDIFSKRKMARERSNNDVYIYDEMPKTLRSQLKQMFTEGVNNYSRSSAAYHSFRIEADQISEIVSILRREYGVDHLCRVHYNSNLIELLNFINECSADHFLDCAEMYGRLLSINTETNDEILKAHMAELNHRFKEASVGYEYINGELIRIDSLVLHSEVLKPTLTILSSNKIYKGAEDEIVQAFQKFKHNDNKGAVSDALKAFESTMKAILDKRQWTYSPNDTASKLIAACFDNNLIPAYMQTHFSGLRTILESGVPTIRNKTSGHGQGSSVKPLDDHFASYVLYTALANMKLLIDCEKVLP
ncbi:STM4504/CBY_0614 family protein [Falsigemmobacter faecalis]|uniref:Abortive infection protein-like C-terminal domain-containing protein n=1 Tax=Falsigemmobacter faecalis TaxID=2488730 RepID=A0A3P3D2M8_9RHOB|nr:hypothetical protein [Falsigemmobacter faecalis]RRH68321.1 hypothetical protein EG244_19550 [Falsigemmobacter faecalis]